MDFAKSSDGVRLLLHVLDSSGSGVTGLGVGDFTWEVYDTGLSAYGDPDSMVEIGQGAYWVEFTNMPPEVWSVWVRHATHFPEGKTAKIMVFDALFDDLAPNSLTALSIADQVWDEARSGHTGSGSFGELMRNIELGLFAEVLIAQSGSTSTEVRTGSTKSDDFYNDALVVVINAAGTAARRVIDYDQTNGAFTVSALPFTPAFGNLVLVIPRPLPDVALAPALAVVDGIVDDILVDTGTSLPAQITSEVNDVQADIAGIETHLDAIDANLGTINSNVILAVLNTEPDAIAAAVWDALTEDYSAPNTFGLMVQSLLTTVEFDKLYNALVLDEPFDVIAGSSTTEVRTNAARPTGHYDRHVLVVRSVIDGNAARAISSYDVTNGAFTVTPALPFTPAAADQVFVVALPVFTQALLQAIGQDALTAQGYTTPRAANLDNLDATVSSRATQASVDALPTNAELAAEIDAVQADIAALNDLSAAEAADAIWDEAKAGHVAAGSFGEEVQTHATAAELSAEIDSVQADIAAVAFDVDAILVDTGTTLPAQITSEINDVQTDIAAVHTLALLCKRVLANRVVVSPDDLTVTVYAEDETTPVIVFDISADGRERGPQ